MGNICNQPRDRFDSYRDKEDLVPVVSIKERRPLTDVNRGHRYLVMQFAPAPDYMVK